jgi:hypothetical protein
MNIKSETCHKLLRGITANKTVAAILVAGVMFLSSCASPPKEILPTYVDPLQYEQYNCSQIGMEMESVTKELNEVYGVVKRAAARDGWMMLGAAIVAWPFLIVPAVISDSEVTEQFAQLQGELEALEQAAILKECDQRMLPEIPEFRKNFSVFVNENSIEILKIGEKEYKLPTVFHRYECLRRIRVHHRDFLEYKSAKEAQDAGQKPCKHCKPRDMTISQERIKK